MKDNQYFKFDNDVLPSDITKASNLLKKIINQSCEKDFVWFDDVDENNMPTAIDILMWILTLESLKTSMNKEE